jgi:TolB protein
VQLTDVPSGDTLPVWSPDGTKIAFQSLRDHNYEIYVMNADGSGQTNLTNHPGKDLEPSWSPDGTQIYFRTDRDGNMYDDYVMTADGSGQVPKP